MKKNIAVIGMRGFPAEFKGTSGIEFYSQSIIKELAVLAPEIHFLVFTREKYQINKYNGKNYLVLPLFTITHKTLETLIYSFIATLKACTRDTSIIWFHAVGSAFFAWLPILFGRKVILTIHSLDWERKKWNSIEKLFFYMLVKIIFLFPIIFTTVSKKLADELKTIYKIEARVIKPGIDLKAVEKIKLSDLPKHFRNSSYLLYLGRVVPEKRIEWLLESTINVPSSFKILIVGHDGNMSNYYQSLRDKYKDRHNVFWLEGAYGKSKLALIKYSKALIIPSELEGQPLVLFEGLSMRANVIIAADFVPKKLLSLRNIYMFNKHSYEDFLKQVNLNIKDEKIKNYLLEELRNLESFSWEKSSLELYKLI